MGYTGMEYKWDFYTCIKALVIIFVNPKNMNLAWSLDSNSLFRLQHKSYLSVPLSLQGLVCYPKNSSQRQKNVGRHGHCLEHFERMRKN